ncbi:DUF562 domain-containing protein [Chlamydia pneumoniae]|uniref:Uncharacterized protein n=3 Tax=Chlamydia pneumoniae TaxID=83558 RepID=Q9JS50_CHLPN|nr:DUF562 domain-containing protein [Chlamydia pneumoniae]AAF38152.1 hypothetical protein CP_0295 [Chlamydia pneumoniae AR39]CRI35826.1 Uncharacterized protein BN1224_CM1_A_04730 [Chlamydia pneumoniae]CRI41473.1 Uncharacterized protein BN1224_GiD_A_04740 [Chlamydia pneumoniae]CRI73111.1 Uncharacterized protein BN1224_YK41_BO_00240 [Chlamydia pneumoniae]BAA98663.1 hypothetical protein [Chlamydia pneumoniae J138]
MASCLSAWFSIVREHFYRAFDFSLPFCARITEFVLGVIKGIPVVGHIIVGIEWLVSRYLESFVTKPTFVSDVVSLLKTEKVAGRDHIARVVETLKRQRVAVAPEDEDKVHGKIPVHPFGGIQPVEVLTLYPEVQDATLGLAFSKIRNRVRQAYLQAPRPKLQKIYIIGNDMNPFEVDDFLHLARLCNETQRLYPDATISLYLTASGGRNAMDKKNRKLLSDCELNPKIACLDFNQGDVVKQATCDCWMVYHGENDQGTLNQIQEELEKSGEETPWIHVGQKPLSQSLWDFSPFSSLEMKGDKEKALEYSELEKEQLYSRLVYVGERSSVLSLGFGDSRSGILMDPKRVHAPLSEGHYCHSYLADLENPGLQKTILAAFLNPKELSSTILQPISLNLILNSKTYLRQHFGFFERMSRSDRNVVVVVCDSWWGTDWKEEPSFQHFIMELECRGYSHFNIFAFRSNSMCVEERRILNESSQEKAFTMIFCEDSVSQGDIRCLHLASEGMLCGKECYAVDVYTSGCANFMMEEVLTLERESNLWNRKHGLWKREVRKQKQEAALDQDESEIYVCNQLTAQQNFACSLDAAIRQSIWRSRMPELLSIERRALGEQLFTTVHHYLTTQKKILRGI